MSAVVTTTKVTNADIYGVLMDLKEDIGGLKTSTTTLISGSADHAARIAVLEQASQRQKGAIGAWGLVATGASCLVGWFVQYFKH